MSAAIVIENLYKTYPVPLAGLLRFLRRSTKRPTEALRGVSFKIEAGEIFGLIGRNGAGKTTLVKTIATLIRPTAGRVLVHGYDTVRDEERVRALIGLATAEERSFYWRLTVEQNLLFFARLYGLPERAARRRVAELLDQFELSDQTRRRFAELSSGNRQRLAVARAMLNSPPVLLLDEPTRSLDPVAAASMRAMIAAAARENGATVLLTSHNLHEIEELCARIAIISRGRIVALDAPQALRARHRQTERVSLTIRNLTRHEAIEALAGFIPTLESAERDGIVELRFLRAPEDEALDRALRNLYARGATIIDCQTEKATLLDVLESYD
ncbi:ABC transporter ATP-binding protein [Pyrinomonas methylaliphatogenes]|uniref:ABC-type multidrug transport system, ATPase component n=1 Tax=Pyrinomonas methylaliphatogenes TaxID=454194 RepID=A0A0B6WX58_9BACT|nr:ABC transporter ATP-binding protein [Pyrinomonas methylaliphatogenes]CDM65332.1 ABC-type multidrug transport system, ATPase component [Pyrinomonas methylaliphatogenes]